MAVVLPIISAFDNKGISGAIKEFKKLEGAGAKANYALGKASKVAAGALAGLAGAATLTVKAAIEDQKSQTLLADTLLKNAGATQSAIAANEAFISSVSQSAAVSDDELRPAMANLARATGSVEDSQKGLQLALDVSAATGLSLDSVSKALSKAYSGNTTALKKLSPQLGNMVEKGASMQEVNDALTKQFGGSAQKAAGTMAGQMKAAGIAIDEAQESIGQALLPIVAKVLPYLAKFGQWAQTHTKTFMIIGGVIGGLAVAVIAVNTAVKIWTATTKAFTAVQALFNAVMAANPIVLVTLAIVAIGAAIYVAYQKFEGFRNIVDTVFSAVKTGVSGVYDFFKKYVDLILGVWKGVFNSIASVWNNTIGKLSFKIPSWVPGIGGKGFDVPDIPKLAAGGIVMRPTLALIGERGPEAVIPLNKSNTPQGGIQVNVYGGDPRATVDAIRRYQKTNGYVPITV